MFEKLTRTAGPGSDLAAMAQGLDWALMLQADDHDTAVTIRDGAVMQVTSGPFVLPSWQTRLSASADEWAAFLQPVPKPGHHDIIALLRRGAIRFDGDLHPLMAHLYYVKRLLASLRAAE
ncbi:hypothetical protein [Pseudooceanicola sp. MF1-13]|uniref:hypothetical protein n=1 Tax=Pseudooceanicola sp. MF1-13 TaxID=3379095 RepID=UPI0038919E17